VAEGRLEIETAVALDPRRASLRTWLGRAYFEEGLTEKAAVELELARDQDLEDPNAYLFAAQERFAANDPIAALRLLEDAGQITGARYTTRSGLGLAEDRAVQGAARGRTFALLGFDERAAVEAARAAEADPANPAAQRFLAESLRSDPDAEMAQTSALLKSDLLSPPSAAPLQPQLAETGLRLLETTGTTRVTFSEFAPLFDANGVRFDGTGLFGTQETWGQETSFSVLHDGFSLALGTFGLTTDGYRPNNDVEHAVGAVQARARLTPRLKLFGEFRHRDTEAGDLRELFDPGGIDATLRQDFVRTFGRIGAEAEIDERTTLLGLVSVGRLSTEDALERAPLGIVGETTDRATDLQVQLVRDLEDVRLTFGGDWTGTRVETESTVSFASSPLPPSRTARDVRQFGAYGYADFTWPDFADWTLGASYDVYDDDDLAGAFRRSEFNPKAGVRIRLHERASLRAAYTRTLKPRLVAEQVIEPVTVAGVNQFVDAINGTVVSRIGFGVDTNPTDGLWLGAGATRSRFDIPGRTAAGARTERQEWAFDGYGSLLLTDRIALSLGVAHERSRSNEVFDPDEWRLTTVPVSLAYFDPGGFFGAVEAEPAFHSFTDSGARRSDQFVMLNAALGWRLPRQHGVVTAEVQNLLDQEVRFQQSSFGRDLPLAPRFAPELTALFRLTLSF
jgi:hypothetical protein